MGIGLAGRKRVAVYILKQTMSTSVTMKTVAIEAQVTQATVSMCLANNPRIPLATRTRIQAIAERLGYRRNPYVSALMRMRRQGNPPRLWPLLALVNGLDTAAAWRNSTAVTVRQMSEGAIKRAAECGYRAEEFWLGRDGMSGERFSDVLHARGIHGLLLGPMATGVPLPRLKWERFSAVRLGVPLAALTLTTVCNDHFFSSVQVMRECWKLGYRRPGLVMLDMHLERFQGRWNGGLLASSSILRGTKPVRTLLLKSWDDLAPLGEWIKRARPDVIISPFAKIIQTYLVTMGWRLPQDIGLASLACEKQGDECSGIFQNGRLIGATGIDMVISMLEHNETGLPAQAQTLMIEGIWNPGRTLRPAEA